MVGGLGHHYGGQGGCGYDNLTLTIIEQVEEKNLQFWLRGRSTGSTSCEFFLKMGPEIIAGKNIFEATTQHSPSLYEQTMKLM